MMKMKSEDGLLSVCEKCRMKKQRSAAKGKANRLAHTLLLIVVCFMASMTSVKAQQNSDRISLGFGCLYERGLDVTLSYEHETKYHNAWEYFANGYIKWNECASCGHVCPESFWNNYRSYGFGFAYKPCVVRGRNHHGNMRIGASAGSDTDRFLGGIHLGYEHNYTLRHGCKLFWQVKTDVMIKGEDLFRTGIVLGVKLPVK